jgi:hypothetical protein
MFSNLGLLSLFLQQEPDYLSGGLAILASIIGFIGGIISLVAMWKNYVKAGQPGWAILIPIYNIYVLLEIVGREWWWLLLLLIPGVNVVIAIILTFDLAKSFGKGTGFGLGLLLLNFIFTLILAFGDAQYVGPAAASM